MPKVLNIEHRDIHIAFDFSIKEIQHLKDIFDHCSIEYNGEEEPEMKLADSYLQVVLYPLFSQIVEKYSSE